MFYSEAMVDDYMDVFTLVFVCFSEKPVCVYGEYAHTCGGQG